MLTYGSLFTGIGGFDLGFDRAGMKCLWQVEINEYCRAVLRKHWPGVMQHDDVKTWPTKETPAPDIICGGFPCQDISRCNTKAIGISGERSGLWSEFARIVRVLRPRYIVIENVPALTFRGLNVVLRDLATARYDAEWQTISGWAFGSHDKRKRLYIVANRADANGFRFQGRPYPISQAWSHAQFTRLVRRVLQSAVPAGRRQRVSDGVSNRVDRLRAVGNTVKPQVAEWIARQIIEHHQKEGTSDGDN